MQWALEAWHSKQRRNKMADRDTGTQDHGEGLVGEVTGTVKDTVKDTTDTVQNTVQDTTGTVKDTVKDTLGTVQDTVGDVKDAL
jgi:uncharacterized protein YjbJ (UPF0337 family)